MERCDNKISNFCESKEKSNELQMRTLKWKENEDNEIESPLGNNFHGDDQWLRKPYRAESMGRGFGSQLVKNQNLDSPVKLRKFSADYMKSPDNKDLPIIDPINYNKDCSKRIKMKYQKKKMDENLYDIMEEDDEDQN